MNKRDKLAAVLVGGTGVLLMTASSAYAYWSTTGAGSGTASATTSQQLSAAPATAATNLYPGVSGVAGTVTVTNPNPFPVQLTVATFAAPTATGGMGTCTTTGVTFTAGTLPIVPAKTGSTNGTVALPFTAAMSNASDTGCQGATFTSTVTLSGQSS